MPVVHEFHVFKLCAVFHLYINEPFHHGSIQINPKRQIMANVSHFIFLVVLIAGLVENATPSSLVPKGLARSKFPKDFLFGGATSAYQVEGAADKDGKLRSIWDTFAHNSGKIADNTTGDVALDQYHRYKEDINLLKEMGMDVFRFSIAWTRIYPKGSPRHGPANAAGIKHYNNVINYALQNGITPLITLFHWDTPQFLEDEYGGWRSRRMIDDFKAFADMCFKEFGDRVKLWATMNEPYIFTIYGYDAGTTAPGRCSKPFGNCSVGNSSTEPYIVGHNLILGHSAVVNLYKTKYQHIQRGTIGITIVVLWALPFSPRDKAAWQRAIDFRVGWFMDPLTRGEYPQSMRKVVGERLPSFTKEESKELINSFDWVGINYYSTEWVVDIPKQGSPSDFLMDVHGNFSYNFKGVVMGEKEGTDAFRYHAPGLRQSLNYLKSRYNNPTLYITETGYADYDNGSVPLKQALNDTGRMVYHQKHVAQALLAINKDGVKLKGYIVWALLDNFEWGSGTSSRMGLIYVDYKNNLHRYMRASAHWFKYMLHR